LRTACATSPDELAILDREGLANLAAIEAFVRDNAIDCDFERTGDLSVADQPCTRSTS
jgi:hypothetical protein